MSQNSDHAPTRTTNSPAKHHTNRLVDETSPYLLQHAHNPVDWYPWGDEALARARSEERLILLSIGYSSCHWCHVMERESFEDEAIAALMNDNFVNVKVDREERPDLDEIYMAATLALNQGQGGWPMTVFLTPELEPVFAGTYFPPRDAYGRPGFSTLLRRIAEVWNDDPESLRRSAAEVVDHLRRQGELDSPLAVGEEELQRALQQYGQDFDPLYGGFGPAPKFPPATSLSLLLRLHRRLGEAQALEMVERTLEGMAFGGLYDQVGGGFARYSTDERWLVPHFEKMLYDNALLAAAYVEAWQATGKPLYQRIVTETLDYVLREMTAPEGGFYSATDADSEGEEGKFFVWTPAEIEAILDPEDARLFCAYYDITESGNWEGKSIPHVTRNLADVAERLGLQPASEADDEFLVALQARLDAARQRVYEARLQRVPPGLDDKILTAWNAMMIRAFALAGQAFDEPRYRQAAARTCDFLWRDVRRDDGRLLRTWRAGRAHLDAVLEDYAYLAEALIDVYETTGEPRYLKRAEELLDRVRQDFGSDDGAFFHTAKDHEQLIVRYREGTDGAIPCGNAVAAMALARLSFHLDRRDLRDAAADAIQAYGRVLARYPRAFAKSLCTVDLLLEGPVELALVGNPAAPDFQALRREVGRHYLPNRILAPSPKDAEAVSSNSDDAVTTDPPLLLAGKMPVDGRAALYVCRDFACQAPVTRPEQVEAALAETATAGSSTASSTAIGRHLEGHATAQGTARYAQRFATALPHGYQELSATTAALTVCRAGFGGYRVDDETAVHRRALEHALRSGVNLIDTSSNYTDGGSERLVGTVLRRLIDAGELQRDEVVVVSKLGYVQGANYARAHERDAAGNGFPEMVKLDDGLWHCLHPEFLEDQLGRSLDRLGLETLDICLLHNPEYFLADASRHSPAGQPLEATRDEFYRRLEAAFAYLEGQVDAGRLAAYGVSSNTVTRAKDDPEATDLPRMLAASLSAARDATGGVASRSHFRVLQLPLNLCESGALLQPDAVLLQARDAGVGVLANRPLNALSRDPSHSGMLRLADISDEHLALSAQDPAAQADVEALLVELAELEAQLQTHVAPQVRGTQGEDLDLFRWSAQLAQIEPRIKNLHSWRPVEMQVRFSVRRMAQQLDAHLDGPAAGLWVPHRQPYLDLLETLLQALRWRAAQRSRAATADIVQAIDPHLPEDRHGEPLSRKALWTVASTPGVTCVLVGIRQPAYVDDVVEVLRWPSLAEPEKVYRALADPGTLSG